MSKAKRVLVVDDDPSLRELEEMILGDEGYVVSTAGNGREALDAVERAMPDVIVLDLKMPIMDGPEFMLRFRARHGKGVAIVALTAAENPALCARAIGADGWLAKPFEVEDLIQLVARFARAPKTG